MFSANIRFQVVSTLILLIIGFDYIRRKKLPIISTHSFTAMLICAYINLFADFITVYTITHMDVVPTWVNRLAHQVFILSMDTVVYMLFLYVYFLARGQKRSPWWTYLLFSIPYLVTVFVVFFGKIKYYNDGINAYSYGQMPATIFIDAAFYLISAMFYIRKKQKEVGKRTYFAIIGGIFIWIIAAFLQYFRPTLLISSVAIALMILYVYLAFINPAELVDKETGVFNRFAFLLMLSETFSRKKPFMIVSISIVNTEKINNEFSYQAFSECLTSVGEYIHHLFKTNVYRFRSSTFIVILPQQTSDSVYENSMSFLNQNDQAWPVSNGIIRLNCRIDIISCPNPGSDENKVLEILDFMVHNRFSKSKVIRVADEKTLQKMERKNNIESMLRNAIQNDGFDVVYQPIFSTKVQRCLSAEALVRLHDQTTIGSVYPDEFIPIGEHIGIIGEIDMIVLRKVCAFAKENHLWEKGIRYIEVNLSGDQINDPNLVKSISSLLNQFNIPKGFINLEITESVAMESGEILQSVMSALYQTGCSFSMDDFGTAYSNLSQTAQTRYDLIKIDKSLIWPCFGLDETDSSRPKIVLESVLSMISELKTEIVAEGVETKEQADFLTNHKVQYLQGFYFSHPVPPEKYLEFIQNECS